MSFAAENYPMTSNKPYFIRAVYDWIVDNGLTPFLLVNPEHEGAQVPTEYVQDGTIVLNISPKACRGLHLGNTNVSFSARFNNVVRHIDVPAKAIDGIYAKENGRGMIFQGDADGSEEAGGEGEVTVLPSGGKKQAPQSRGKSFLKLIK